MTVNISAKFSKENKPRNGLVQIESKLVDDDLLHAEYWGLVRVKPNFYKVDGEDGSRTPTVEIAHIEVVTDEADVEVVRTLLQRRYKDRTGIDDQEPADLFSVLPSGEGDGDGAGERRVPEASAEELVAEHREAQAAKAAAPAAEFSGGGDAA
ncbi:hypothetical protein [Micromonospora deserti]|uniref:Uncharacterized protein n=1 Tax=Micromonospora deserti TaxID=2070366 RepID=A0A2W2DN13_9ACTN|nr:hypothetical protein [Micromonospora deserti]PZF98526.1 hypothetical protein C1I99_13275 [Micromonospora deserti]